MNSTIKQKKAAVRSYQQHHLTPVLKALKHGGVSLLDQRTGLAKAAWALRAEIIRDCGGEDALSVQQIKLVDEFLKRYLMLESIDAWLFSQPALINKRTRSLYPVVVQRQTIADGMVRVLERLGLERRARAIPNIQDYLKQKGAAQP